MYELESIWSQVQKLLRQELMNVTYNTWIDPLRPLSMENGEIIISAPNKFTKRMVESKYASSIERAIAYLNSDFRRLTIVEPGEDDYLTTVNKSRQTQQLKLFEDPPAEEREEDFSFRPQNNLNPKYTFDTFVKGKSNEFALAACIAVAQSPAEAYNPLFLYGGAGLGKTHLMQATARRILDEDPLKKVLYLTSETFTNELISSLGDKSTKKNKEFRDKYRKIDVLLIDDIQFIAGKTGTQEEFFHTFNDLYGANKQIILSSDRPPKDIKPLEERLTSRFEWGLIADIQQPDFETRVAILQNKLKLEKIDIPMEVLEYIAMNIKSNIRELEGALLTVIAYSSLMKREDVDLDFAKEALKKVIQEKERREVNIQTIMEVTASAYNIRVEDFSSKNRQSAIAHPRQIAMYLSRNLTELSLVKIAESFHRDHTTIMHGIDKIESKMEMDPDFRKEIENLIRKIRQE
jgi:chromosomal replication initiator protein